MLKNDRNTFYPRFSFIPKTVMAFPKTGAFFLLCTFFFIFFIFFFAIKGFDFHSKIISALSKNMAKNLP